MAISGIAGGRCAGVLRRAGGRRWKGFEVYCEDRLGEASRRLMRWTGWPPRGLLHVEKRWPRGRSLQDMRMES